MKMPDYVVKGEPTDPVAEAFRAWLDARRQLDATLEPVFRRVGTPVDPAALTDLRSGENLAWLEFRTARLMDEGGW